jgi:recombinational DNA repair protein (RecF pathway)
MKLEKATGIILKKHIIQEKDVIIDVIIQTTDHVYLRKKFIVYGILKSKKRSSVIVEIGNMVELNYYDKKEREIQTIKEINLINRYYELKDNYDKLVFLSILLELCNYASIADSHTIQDIYILLLSGLNYLQNFYKNDESLKEILILLNQMNLSFKEIFLLFFSVRLLKISGYVGDLSKCSSCNNKIKEKAKWQEGLYFYCKECDPTSNMIDFFYLKILENITENKFNNFINNFIFLIQQSNIKKEEFLNVFHALENKINHYLKEVFPLNEKINLLQN